MSFIKPCANCQKDSEVHQTLSLALGRLWSNRKESLIQSVQKWDGKRVRMGVEHVLSNPFAKLEPGVAI